MSQVSRTAVDIHLEKSNAGWRIARFVIRPPDADAIVRETVTLRKASSREDFGAAVAYLQITGRALDLDEVPAAVDALRRLRNVIYKGGDKLAVKSRSWPERVFNGVPGFESDDSSPLAHIVRLTNNRRISWADGFGPSQVRFLLNNRDVPRQLLVQFITETLRLSDFAIDAPADSRQPPRPEPISSGRENDPFSPAELQWIANFQAHLCDYWQHQWLEQDENHGTVRRQ